MSGPERFFLRTASLAGIVPSVAAPAILGYAGRSIGSRYPALGPELGGLIGGISGGIGGQLIRERVESVPPGAPYALDPTSADIPPWALQGAHMLQPMMKQGGHFGDIVGGDLGGLAWPVAEGLRNNQSSGDIARNVAGQGLGTLGGGLIGHGVGHVIDKVVGHPVMGPMNIPLTTILSGLGATMGNVKGLELARR